MSPINATKTVNLPQGIIVQVAAYQGLSHLKSTRFSLSFVLHWRPCILCRCPKAGSNIVVIVMHCAEALLVPFNGLHDRPAD